MRLEFSIFHTLFTVLYANSNFELHTVNLLNDYFQAGNISANSVLECAIRCDLNRQICCEGFFNAALNTCVMWTANDGCHADIGQNISFEWIYLTRRAAVPGHCTSCFGFGRSWYEITFRKVSMEAAKNECIAKQGKLVEIETALENAAITDFILTIDQGGTVLNYWLGGYNVHLDQTFEWLSNPSEPIQFNGFHSDEPNGRHADEYCLVAYAENNYQWVDISCDDPAAFICEFST